jgi:hypothetical protein
MFLKKIKDLENVVVRKRKFVEVIQIVLIVKMLGVSKRVKHVEEKEVLYIMDPHYQMYNYKFLKSYYLFKNIKKM